MQILLCSADETVRKRWEAFLAAQEVRHAATIPDIKKILAEKNSALLLLHRPLADPETVREIRRAISICRIFLFSDRPTEDEGLAFLKLGIVGYANTYISPPRFAEAIRVVQAGSVWIGQKVMQRLIKETTGKSDPVQEPSPSLLDELTSREREIVKLVAMGLSNLEIAFELEITERTVKAHLSSIYAKTGTGSRLNLALHFNQNGRGLG